jgi:hypothetical protein
VTWEKYSPPHEKDIKKRGVIQRLSSLNEQKGWVTQVALMSESMLYFTAASAVGSIGRMLDCIPLHDVIQVKSLASEPGWRNQVFPGTRFVKFPVPASTIRNRTFDRPQAKFPALKCFLHSWPNLKPAFPFAIFTTPRGYNCGRTYFVRASSDEERSV